MWHVGVLYRLPDLLELLIESPLSRKSLIHSFGGRFHNVRIENVIDVALKGNWVEINESDNLILTTSGRSILSIHNQIYQLRYCINVLIDVLKPHWIAFAIQGRGAIRDYVTADVFQCLDEAGYLTSSDEDVINWWDRLASQYRTDKDAGLTETGRQGERKSVEYETIRIGKQPLWRSLEYSYLGYDIISQISGDNPQNLLIEVKTSSLPWNTAHFYLTRNEWNVLSQASNAVLHLWSLPDCTSSPSVVDIDKIFPHIPNDQGEAKWQEIKVPFSVFPCPVSGK